MEGCWEVFGESVRLMDPLGADLSGLTLKCFDCVSEWSSFLDAVRRG